jgi:hypothetical protein
MWFEPIAIFAVKLSVPIAWVTREVFHHASARKPLWKKGLPCSPGGVRHASCFLRSEPGIGRRRFPVARPISLALLNARLAKRSLDFLFVLPILAVLIRRMFAELKQQGGSARTGY